MNYPCYSCEYSSFESYDETPWLSQRKFLRCIKSLDEYDFKEDLPVMCDNYKECSNNHFGLRNQPFELLNIDCNLEMK